MLMKTSYLIYLASAMLALIAACGVNTMVGDERPDSEMPIRKMVVSFDEGQHDQFFEEMEEFADKHGFAIRIAPTTPEGSDYVVEMWREDFKILAVNPFDPRTFKVAVYRNDNQEVPSEYLDNLINDFEDFSREVSGAEFEEQ